jgi:transposase
LRAAYGREQQRMNPNFLDFEQPIAELDAKIQELRRVKKAYEQLKIEHDLLKKAIAFTSDREARSLPSSSTSRTSTP